MKYFVLTLVYASFISSIFAQPINIYERPIQSEPSHFFDVLHYRISLVFDGKNRAFEGENVITFRSLKEGLESILLDAETYQIRTVKQASGKMLGFSHQQGKLSITFDKPLSYADTLSIVITYGTTHFEVNSEAFGMAANYPLGLGFFDETPDQPFLFNAYSFPTGARHWFPCYDHPNDRATHETIVTTQSDHKVLANGLLQSVKENDDNTVTYHWKQDQPHPTYLYSFISGPYEIVEDSYDGMQVNYWVYPQDRFKARRSFHRTPEILAFFEDYYGVKYPWDKYDQITVPGIGGGAEATTATLIGASTLHDEQAEPDFPSHWLVAHEAAHHWWGDFISYRDWTQTWMSESFATFSEYLYSNHLYGETEGDLNLYNKRSAYLNEAKNRYQRPIVFNQWETPNQNFDRHTYEKGALVLNMLRDYLGEATFQRVLQHFLSTHAYQPVDTHDFMKSIWEVTGQNLDWFFDQWIFGAGHPILDIAYEWKEGKVLLTVSQVQDTSENIAVFKMPVKIAITTSNQTQIYEIWLREKSESFSFPSSEKPQLVRFDVGNVLLKEWTFVKSAEELLFQAQHDDMLGRLWATQQLASHLNIPSVVTTLKDIATTDTFWAVRREAIQTLSKWSKPINDVLETALQADHARIRVTAISLLGEQKNEAWHERFKSLYETDSSYLVQAEAIRAMGKLKQAADRAFFEEVMQIKSPRNILQNATTWALEQLEN